MPGGLNYALCVVAAGMLSIACGGAAAQGQPRFQPDSRHQAASPYQLGEPWLQADPGYRAAGPDALARHYPGTVDPPKDLAARVAELEAALTKIEQNQATARKAAAGKPSVQVGGRIQADWALFDQNATSNAQAGDFDNGTEFRRARIFVQGDAFYVMDYKIQIDFAPSTTVRDASGTDRAHVGQAAFKDVYLTVKELPVLGKVRVGHFKTPFSLEQLTSAKYITFMERALPLEQIAEGRRTGVMAFDHNEAETSTWAIGGFVSQIPENPPIFRNDSGGYALVTRYTYLPWYDEATDGRGLLHTGICHAYGDIAEGNTVRFRRRPEAHLAERVVDTGGLADVPDFNALCAETALVYGPFSTQAEYVGYWLDRTASRDAFLHGAYAQLSYFLTGEHRPYRRSTGHFDRVKPLENFFCVRDIDGNPGVGKGAWELAYRWSFLDLNDSGINGGFATDHTIGINWYLNPYSRLMFNYVNSNTTDHPDAPETGRADVFETRFEINF